MTTTEKPVMRDHLKSKKKPVTRSVWISLDPELSEEVDAIDRKVAALRPRAIRMKKDERLQQELVAAEAELAEKQAELKENSQKFVFRSLSRRKYDDLLTHHQPTDEQQKMAKEQEGPDAVLEFNPETFPEALVAACLQEPSLSPEEIHEIFIGDDWNGAETMALFQTALTACISRGGVNLGNG